MPQSKRRKVIDDKLEDGCLNIDHVLEISTESQNEKSHRYRQTENLAASPACSQLCRMQVQVVTKTSVLFVRVKRSADLSIARVLLQWHVHNAATKCNMQFVEERSNGFLCVSDAGRQTAQRDRPCALDDRFDVANSFAFAIHLQQRLKADDVFVLAAAAAGLQIEMGMASGSAVLLGSRRENGFWTPSCVLSVLGDAADLAEAVTGRNSVGLLSLHRSALLILSPTGAHRASAASGSERRPAATFDYDTRTFQPCDGTRPLAAGASTRLAEAAEPAQCRSRRPADRAQVDGGRRKRAASESRPRRLDAL